MLRNFFKPASFMHGVPNVHKTVSPNKALQPTAIPLCGVTAVEFER